MDMRSTNIGGLIIGSTNEPKFIKKMLGKKTGRIVYSSSEDPNHTRSTDDIMRIIFQRIYGEEGLKELRDQFHLKEDDDTIDFMMNLIK